MSFDVDNILGIDFFNWIFKCLERNSVFILYHNCKKSKNLIFYNPKKCKNTKPSQP